jgi:hypothetical protein
MALKGWERSWGQDGCPWCGQSAEEMMMASGLGFDQALEAHVQECEPAQAEMGRTR